MRISFLIWLSLLAGPLQADIAVWAHQLDDECELAVPLEELPSVATDEQWQSYLEGECNEFGAVVEILITDVIKPDDTTHFRNALPRLRELIFVNKPSPEPIFSLNSPGGDVFAAIAIGKMIRENFPDASTTWIPHQEDCVSSCVLIYASGLNRRMGAGSRLGIHRPYFSDERFTELGYESRQQVYQQTYDGLRTIMQNYNVSTELVDLMWSTPSTEVHYLSEEEIKRYRLKGVDLVKQETDAALLRQYCGAHANSMKEAYYRDLKQTQYAYRQACDRKFPLPDNCASCTILKNCTPQCKAASDNNAHCYIEIVPSAIQAMEKRHEIYLDCSAEYQRLHKD